MLSSERSRFNTTLSKGGNKNVKKHVKIENLLLHNHDKNRSKRYIMYITVIGKKKSGKSSLIECFLSKSFKREKQDTTLDIYCKKLLINKREISLIISEVSQDKSDFELSKEIISKSHIVFVCFSLEEDYDNEDILDESITLLQTISKSIPVFIVGCKFDLIKEESIDNMKISENNDELTFNGKNIKEYIISKRNSLSNNFAGYYITSALLNINIEKLFHDAIKTVALPIIIASNKMKELNMKNKNINENNNELGSEENKIKNNSENEGEEKKEGEENEDQQKKSNSKDSKKDLSSDDDINDMKKRRCVHC